jgi:beta-galactosidase
MWVMIRPGPYVCAEWDAGGHPWWLMKKEGIQLRTSDPQYVEAVTEYISHVVKIIAP